MIKPKAALVKDGFLPPGSENKKGRLSGAAIERLKVLASEGMSIEGFSSSTDKSTGAVTVEKESTDSTGILNVREPYRNLNDWVAYIGGKKIHSLKEVCRRCSQSFTYCMCEKPLFPLDVDTFGVVVFKPTSTHTKR